VADRLHEYRRRRDPARTPEPVPARAPERGRDDRFVIQQHHARRLHWDLRLERDGVLVSWAVPRGLPRDPGRNHLAVHTEDHPMEYLDFSGEIPAGEYGGGRMTVFDRGTYTCEKWRDDEVMVVLHGERVAGQYVLFQTRGKDWMIRRMDPPPPGWTSMPDLIRPMWPMPAAKLPADDDAWAYEMRWAGTRAIGYVSGGRLRLLSGDDDEDITSAYPQLRELAEELAPIEAVLDGELVTFDETGRVRPPPAPAGAGPTDRGPAGKRPGRPARRPAGRRADAGAKTQYLIFDLLWLEGSSSLELPYAQRRELLDGLALAGGHWQTPPHFVGGGAYALRASREQSLPGVLAKRLDSTYVPGRRTRRWLMIDG
jgi:bifunctional non-homologous end joining protein LigD